MKFRQFEGFGVEVYKNREWQSTRYFDGVKEAFEYAKDKASAGYTYHIITCDKWGNVIDNID